MGLGEIEMFTADYWMMTLLGLTFLASMVSVGCLVMGEYRGMACSIILSALSVGGYFVAASAAQRQDSTVEVYAQVATAVRNDPSLTSSLRRYMSDGRLSPMEARSIGREVDVRTNGRIRTERLHEKQNARWEKARVIAQYGPKEN